MCGAVQYKINGEIGPVINCHCLKCRRWHNAAFRTRVGVAKKYFNWVQGEALIGRCHSSGNVIKAFCKNCGSNLVSYIEDKPEVLGVPTGALEGEDAAKLTPCMHIFVGSKAPWFEINDDLPQYDEWPPGGADAVRKG